MVSLALSSGNSIKNVKVDDTLVFEPVFGLVDDYGLTFGHLDCHASSFSIVIEELSLGLIELLGHRGGHSVLVHEQIVPVRLIIEVCPQNLLLLFLII